MGLTLRKKSIYTALTKILNIGLSFFVQFFITPLILGGLGKELFGVYTIINKMQGYLSVVDLRPTAILRFKLATLQSKKELNTSREYIGASLIITAFLLPFMVLLGWLLSIGFEHFFKIDEQYVSVGKTAIIILSIFISLKGFLGLPEAIIRGNNAEYKLFYIEPLRLLLYSVLVYLFIENGYGILGVIAAIILASLLDFGLKLILQIRLFPKYKPLYPKRDKINEFFGKGSWYLVSSFSSQILNTFDIIIIGITIGAQAVTVYALSKAMLFRVSESVSAVLGGMTASIGHLIGLKDTNKLIELRYKLLRYNLILGSMIASYFVYFNNVFIGLWVDSSNFIGEYANLILSLSALFTLLCLVDEIFINSLQLFKNKSKILLISVTVFLSVSYFFTTEYGLLGIALSLLIAKIVQWFYYEKLLQKHFHIKKLLFIKSNFKTIILLVVLVITKFTFINLVITSWWLFLLASTLYVALYSLIVFVLIFTNSEKQLVYKFINFKKWITK